MIDLVTHDANLRAIQEVVSGLRSWAVIHGSVLGFVGAIDFGTFDLVYADLPYCTGQDFYLRKSKTLAYSDRYNSPMVWAEEMSELVLAVRDRVKCGGNLLTHVDWRYSHLLRTEIAKYIEGTVLRHSYDLTNEIVWRYRRMPSKSDRQFQSVHDTIYRWTRRGAPPIFHQLYEPLAPSTLKQWGTLKQQAVVKDGVRVKSSSTAIESPGVRMGDVWELPIVAPSASERTDYPTQKSEALLDRVVLSMSNVGGLVVDLTCGSGTTGASALKNGRRFIGFDTSSEAVRIATERLSKIASALGSGG